MNKFGRSLRILSSIALLTVAPSAAFAISSCDAIADNLIQNCGFEDASFAYWNQADPSGFSGYDTHNVHSGVLKASLGAVGAPGTLSQTVTDVAGSYYALSFFLENEVALDGNGTAYPGGNSFDVSVTNASNQTTDLLNVTNMPETISYSAYEYFFFGTGTETITFTDTNVPSYFDLDDVILVDPPAPGSAAAATPEPSSLVLMGTGVLVLAGFARRKMPKMPVMPAF